MDNRNWKRLSRKEFDSTHGFALKSIAHQFGFEEPIFPTNEDVEKNLKVLKEIVDRDFMPRFFEVVDMRLAKFAEWYGSECIGYPNVTIYERANSIHPLFRERYYNAAKIAFKIIFSEKDSLNLEPIRTSYCMHLPIWDRVKQKAIWVRRRSMPFRFDAKGNMVQYVNLYQYLRNYEGIEPMHKIVMQGKNKEDEKITELLRYHLSVTSKFTTQEISILEELYYLYEDGYKSGVIKQNELREKLAQRLSKTVGTMRKHFENIKTKSVEIFGEDMRDKRVQEIAVFCHQEKII